MIYLLAARHRMQRSRSPSCNDRVDGRFLFGEEDGKTRLTETASRTWGRETFNKERSAVLAIVAIQHVGHADDAAIALANDGRHIDWSALRR